MTPSLGDSLARIAARLRALERRDAAAAGLRTVHLEVLRHLSRPERAGDTPSAVATALALTKGTVSQTLRVLERRGLVMRRPDEDDRRVVHFEPTGLGRALGEASPRAWEAALAGLSARDRGRVQRALDDVLRAVGR